MMAWNRDLILAQKKYLSEMFERTKDDLIEERILCLNEILNFNRFQFFEPSPRFKIKKQEDAEVLCMFENFIPDIEEAFRHIELYNISINDIHLRAINEEDLLSFTNDFFKILDKELYEVFLQVYKHRKYNFQRSNIRSCTFAIGGYGFSYVNVEFQNTIEEYFEATHEYGHTIQDRIFYRPIETDNYPFHEILSFFSEYLSILYYERLHPEDVEDIKSIKNILLLVILLHVKRIMYYYRVADCDNRTKLEMLLNIKKVNNASFHDAKKTINDSLYERFFYSIPFLTLIELLYAEDLEKSIYIIKKLIKLPTHSDYISELAANGIILTEHLKDFIEYTEKNHDSKILHI